MSRTKRNIPKNKLTPLEETYVKKGKFKHVLNSKCGYYESDASQSNKKEAKKEKHRKQRIEAVKEINESNKLLKTDIPAEQKENLKAYISWVGSILNDVNTNGGIFNYVYGK